MVSDVRNAVGQPRNEPRVHSPGRQLAPLGAAPDLRILEQQLELGRGEIGIEDEAGALPYPGSRPSARRASHRAVVRRSCQTMARWTGRSVARSQSTTVSRWLVIPMPAGCFPGGPKRLATGRERRQEEVLGIVLHPAGLRIVLGNLPIPAAEDAAILMDDQRC